MLMDVDENWRETLKSHWHLDLDLVDDVELIPVQVDDPKELGLVMTVTCMFDPEIARSMVLDWPMVLHSSSTTNQFDPLRVVALGPCLFHTDRLPLDFAKVFKSTSKRVKPVQNRIGSLEWPLMPFRPVNSNGLEWEHFELADVNDNEGCYILPRLSYGIINTIKPIDTLKVKRKPNADVILETPMLKKRRIDDGGDGLVELMRIQMPQNLNESNQDPLDIVHQICRPGLPIDILNGFDSNLMDKLPLPVIQSRSFFKPNDKLKNWANVALESQVSTYITISLKWNGLKALKSIYESLFGVEWFEPLNLDLARCFPPVKQNTESKPHIDTLLELFSRECTVDPPFPHQVNPPVAYIDQESKKALTAKEAPHAFIEKDSPEKVPSHSFVACSAVESFMALRGIAIEPKVSVKVSTDTQPPPQRANTPEAMPVYLPALSEAPMTRYMAHPNSLSKESLVRCQALNMSFVKRGLNDHEADVIIDQQNCIAYLIFMNRIESFLMITQNSSESAMSPLVERILRLALAFTRILLILEIPAGSIAYPFTPPAQASLQYLYEFVATLPELVLSTVSISFSNGPDQTAWLIRSFADNVCDTLPPHQLAKAWRHREWLKDDPTRQETFLSSFGIMNPAASQIILSQQSLGDFVISSQDEKSRFAGWIEPRRLSILDEMLSTRMEY